MIDYNSMNHSQLLYRAKRGQNNLIRRKANLEAKIQQEPGVYSPHGLRALEGYTDSQGNVKEGIPSVSKNDSLNALRAKVRKIDNLDRMQTTKVQGAKDVQRRQIRLAVDLPQEGRLNAADSKRFKEAQEYVKQHPDAMAVFYEGFQAYKRESYNRGIDSDRLLEEYRPFLEQARKDGYTTMNDVVILAKEYADEKYEEQEEDDFYAKFIKDGGGFGL